jgi:dipeptidyl-peptidase-4
MASEPTRPTFPIEAIAAYPAPGMGLPNAFAFSHDDLRVTYLVGAGTPPVQQLHALDVASGASAVLVDPASEPAQGPMSPAEELRRQRARVLARGLTEYRLAEHADTLVFPLGGDVYAQESARTPQRLLVDVTGRSPALTPQLSPDGEWVAYAQDGEVFVISVAGDPPQQITSGARERGWTHGLAEYIAQEELGRSEGFWWSPDGRSIAFTEVDDTHIPIYRIMHQGKDATGPSAQEDHRYPFAGAANASVRLAIVGRGGGAPVWMDLDYDEEVYLARVFWWRDGQLGAVVVNRPQTAIEVLRFEPATGRRATVLRETHDVWINLPRRPVTLLDDGSFLWASERTGYRHLYRYAGGGALIGQLTAGEWMVDEIEGVDEQRGLAYFTGNQGDPRETQLFAVALAGGAVRRITDEPGTHAVTLDHGGRYFVDVSSAIDRAPQVTLRSPTARGRRSTARSTGRPPTLERDPIRRSCRSMADRTRRRSSMRGP